MRAPLLRIHADELIVDNFAGGGGASLGIEWALGRSPDIAVNHDPEAVAMHAANHPPTTHYTTQPRFGLVTVTIDGEEYVVVDIGMRMLEPRELFRAQGFTDDYEIAPVGPRGKPLTKTEIGRAHV